MPKLGPLLNDPIYEDPYQADDGKLLSHADAAPDEGIDCRIIIRGAEQGMQIGMSHTQVAIGDYEISVRVSEVSAKPREGQVFVELDDEGLPLTRYVVIEDALLDDSTREEWFSRCRLLD